MAAFNWIVVEMRCPACRCSALIRCQTHVASAYGGDAAGRFHDCEYRLGQPMRWWSPTDPRFGEWRAGREKTASAGVEHEEEACHAECSVCAAALFVVIRFRQNVPEAVVEAGRVDDWPAGFLR